MTMPRPTARGVALFAVAAGTYVAARLFGTWELYLVSLAFLAALLVSWLLVWSTGRRLRAARTLAPERPVAGDELLVSLRVRNGSVIPGLQVTLRDAVGDLGGGGEAIEIGSLASLAERTALAGPLAARRGVHHLPPLVADAEDPLGLVHVSRSLGDPLELTVYPRLAHLPSCALLADVGALRERGRRGLAPLGAPEFRGIRPHYAGEPLSRVDWKATARTGNLMVREMDDPASNDVAVLLDASAAHVVGEVPDTNLELAVDAAGSIAAFALRAGRGVSLLLHERGWTHVRLSPDTGGHHRLLESLARVEARRSSQPAPSLGTAFAGRGALRRAQTLTLVVLALDHELVRTVMAARDDGLQVAVVHVAPGSFAPAAAAQAAGTGAADGESRRLLLSLASAGVLCLTLHRGDDLRVALSPWQGDALRAVPG